MSGLQRQRQIRALIHNEGLDLVAIVQGRHYKCRVRDREGAEHLLVFSRSPSDWRADRNALSLKCRQPPVHRV